MCVASVALAIERSAACKILYALGPHAESLKDKHIRRTSASHNELRLKRKSVSQDVEDLKDNKAKRKRSEKR